MAKKGSIFNKYSYEFKLMVVEDYFSGYSGGINKVTKKYGLKSNKQIRDWIKLYQEDPKLLETEVRGKNSKGRPKTIKLDEMSLEQQVEYLKMENDILSSPTKIKRAIKYQVIDCFKDKYSISDLCIYLDVSRAAYYKWLNNNKPLHNHYDEILANLIKTIFDDSLKGHRYITYQLRRLHGIIINRKTVLRYMQILGIQSPIRKKKYKSCTQREVNEKARIVCTNVLARDFKADRPYKKLITDVSYIYHKNGRLFLSVIKDLYDNYIIAYTVSKFNDNKLVFDNVDLVFNENWDNTNECILHSDQWFQYTNLAYIKKLDSIGITISHSSKGNCYDNASCENFFSHIKGESLELDVPEDEEELVERVEKYVKWYNNNRPQEKLKGMTPFEFRSSYLNY